MPKNATAPMLRHYTQLIAYKAYADLRSEASRTYLGFLWWAFEPLMFLAVFWIVRGMVFGRSDPHAIEFLLIGIVTFQWFRAGVNGAAGSILGGRSLMLRLHLPKIVFPLASLLTNTIKFACLFAVLLAVVWAVGLRPNAACAALPALLAVQACFVAAVALFSAAIVPLLPDLRFLIENLMMAAFWLSGVFFSVETVPQEYRAFFYLNPMACLIEDYRGVLIEGRWPDWSALGTITLASLLGVAAAAALIRRFDYLYPKVTQ